MDDDHNYLVGNGRGPRTFTIEGMDAWAAEFPEDWVQRRNAFETVHYAYPGRVSLMDRVQWLLSKGWNPCHPTQNESPLVALQKFCADDATPVMRLLISQGVDIDAKYLGKYTPLDYAIQYVYPLYARFLIYSGAQWPDSRPKKASDQLFQNQMYRVYRAMGHCRLAQRATIRALTKCDPRLRDAVTHLIAPMIWASRSSEKWEKRARFDEK